MTTHGILLKCTHHNFPNYYFEVTDSEQKEIKRTTNLLIVVAVTQGNK